jgi:hypothetical protein
MSQPERSPSGGAVAVDLLSFVGTAVAAVWLGWATRDLIWGLWLSSLTIGYATLLLSIGGQYWFTHRLPIGEEIVHPAGRLAVRGVSIGMGLFTAAFFTVHFGGFHLVHGAFLNAFFPLAPGGSDPFDYLALLPEAARIGWPLMLGSLVSARHDLRQAPDDSNFMRPYLNVIRMHLLIFVFAGAAAVDLDQRWLYVVVLFFYFFPFREIRRLLPGRS